MIQEDTYKIKFEKLAPWAIEIFQVVKKDLRNEHLLKSPSFVQKHFAKRALDKLTTEEIASAYLKEIAEGDEELGGRIVSRWVIKNADLYNFFAYELAKINPKYNEIESISDEMSVFLLNASIHQYGAISTYLFCILNAVVFTDQQLKKLREMALSEKAQQPEEKPAFKSVDDVKEHYEKELRKVMEKCENKVQGLERKYIQDVEGLKKQIAQLHKKLAEKAVVV